ncbi:MAG: hypothetical protein AB7L66_16485 [Gemmatimonadales bacterium]
MPQRSIEVAGVRWIVSPSGRRTQYGKDEFTVKFARADGAEERLARYSPQGTKAREDSLAEMSAAALAGLLARSQPSWTDVEAGYRR